MFNAIISMKFGKLDDISGVDFTLPPDNILTSKTLTIENNTPLEVFIGPPEWGIKEWVGKIYPIGTKPKDYFENMTKHFNTIELNSLFYAIPNDERIDEWKAKARKDFKFCPKFPKSISHDKKLINAEAETEAFYKALFRFGDNIGRTFLQLSEYYEPNQLKNLEKYLRSLPKNFSVSVELRNEKWYSDKVLWNDTCVMFQELGIGTILTDVAGNREVLHMTLTDNSLMLRFLSNNQEPSAYSRIDEWCLRIKDWIAQGLKTIYIFVHTHSNISAPEMADYWVKKLNEINNLRIRGPRMIPPPNQLSLF